MRNLNNTGYVSGPLLLLRPNKEKGQADRESKVISAVMICLCLVFFVCALNPSELTKQEVNVLVADTIRKEKGSESKKKRLYLHLGVQKSGTTTLQESLYANSGRLRMNGFNYICHGKYPVHMDGENNCLGNPALQCSEEDILKDKPLMMFRKCLSESKGKHSVYSGETLISDIVDTEHNWKILQNELKDFDVTVILTYRRYFEWLPSYYFQLHRRFEPGVGTGWIDESALPTFPDWYHLIANDADPLPASITRRWQAEVGRGEMHPIESEIAKISPYFPDVRIHNMHARSGDFVTSFYCDIINAEFACKDRRLSKDKNPTKSHDYDVLSLAAYHKGLIFNPKELSRANVAVSARLHHLKNINFHNGSELPLKCLSSEQQDELLIRSLELEQRILPGWYENPEFEVEHLSRFESYAERGKFCGVDSVKALEDEQWQYFFTRSLTKKQNKN